jgi:hypothetical protein
MTRVVPKVVMSVLSIALFLLIAMGCGDEGASNGGDSPFQVFIPVASQVVVSVGGTYLFESDNPDGEEPLGTCTVSLGGDSGDLALIEGPFIDAPDVVLANFQRALPRQSDDFFSIQVQGDFVSWGLFDNDTGARWSNRPDGELKGGCQGGGTGVLCHVLWTGEATDDCTSTENCTEPEVREATVEMYCLFSPEPPCTLSCGDGNPCTIDVCRNSQCIRENLPVGAICGPGVEGPEGRVPELCTADGECSLLLLP